MSEQAYFISTKLRIWAYSTCVLLYGSETWTLIISHKLIGKDWIPSMYDANDVSCTSAGTTSYPTTRF